MNPSMLLGFGGGGGSSDGSVWEGMRGAHGVRSQRQPLMVQGIRDCARTKSGLSKWCTMPAPVNNEPTVKEERRKNCRLWETGLGAAMMRRCVVLLCVRARLWLGCVFTVFWEGSWRRYRTVGQK